MSFREKIRLNFPLYFTLSLLFFVAVASLWLPKLMGRGDETEAAPITNFSTAVTAVSRVPSGSQVKIAYNAGTYAMVFTSNTVAATSATSTCAYLTNGDSQQCSLYFTKSTDGGVTWGTPVLVSSGVYYSSNREELGSFLYDPRRNVWVVTYKIDDDNGNYHIVQSYSSTGASWTTATVLSDNNAISLGYVGRSSVIAFATSSNLRAVLGQRGDVLEVGTTTNTGLTTSWPTSTIRNVSNYKDNNAGNWEYARPLGLSIDYNNNIHAVFALATTTAAGGYEIVYASSTNLGTTWTTSSISGRLPTSAVTDVIGLELGMNSAEVDPYTGRLTVLYHHMTSLDSDLLGAGIISGTTTLRIAQLGANGVWTTSTINRAVPFRFNVPSYDSNFNLVSLHPNSVTVPYTGVYAGAFFGTSSYPYIAINSSTLVMEQINSTVISNMSEMGTAYNSTTKELAVAFVDMDNYRIKFTTTSMKLAQVNDAATSTEILGESQPQDASGILTFSTTISDRNYENVTLYVDYSLDHGTTWTSTTLASATGEAGALTTATGRITNISMAAGEQDISFTWDTSVILAASSTSAVRIRILADDGYSHNGYRQTDSFPVDNEAAGVPGELVLSSVESTSLTLLWTASTGTPTLYLASSTAQTATATSTSATTTAYNNLSPNTLYLFQVKAQDTYSNTSSYSAATSTYTDALAPTAISAASNGTTSMTVSWTSTNGAGTNYQLYNVTTETVVGITTATSYLVTGLTAGTSYQFKVRAQYLQDNSTYTDYSDTSTAVSTDATSSGGGGGGGASPSASAPPVAPTVVPTAQSSATLELELQKPKDQKVGASEHTFTVQSATSQKLRMKVESDPQVVDLVLNVPLEVDTNKDAILDLRLQYLGLVQGKPKIKVTTLTDENELNNPVTIQAGAYETNSLKVSLRFNVSGVTQMAVSNNSNFTGASFVPFVSQMNWNLDKGTGLKTVYVRLRNAQGGVVTVSDTITLASNSASNTVPEVPESSVTEPANSVPVLTKTLKRNMVGAEVTILQNELKRQGFFPKTIAANGVFGPTTEKSVKALEKARAIRIDGIVDQATWMVLFNQPVVTTNTNSNTNSITTPTVKSTPTLYLGMSGVAVTEVQTKLQSLGYFPKTVKVNGYFGPATKKAVQDFQKANKISTTGNVGQLTWTALNK